MLVSPGPASFNSFMKQAKSNLFYMGVWSLDELFCWNVGELFFLMYVPSVDVVKAFDDVGGVARAVFLYRTASSV